MEFREGKWGGMRKRPCKNVGLLVIQEIMVSFHHFNQDIKSTTEFLCDLLTCNSFSLGDSSSLGAGFISFMKTGSGSADSWNLELSKKKI